MVVSTAAARAAGSRSERPRASGQDSPWQALSGCSHALSRATSSSTRSGSAGALSDRRASASSAICRPEVLAARKNTLSMCCAGAALSNGNSVPMVLPMPVGAWASRQRPATAALYTASAPGGRPGGKGPKGKRQGGQCRIACRAVGHLLFGPCNEALALRLEVLAQVVGAAVFGEHRLLLRAHVQIHQRHVDVR